jgi:type II secretory pathway pseudopilin PulG
MRRNQSGMTLISFVVVAAVVGFFLYIIAKLFPMYNEYYAVRSSLKALAAESGVASQDPTQIKDTLINKRLYVNQATSVRSENIFVEQVNGGTQVRIEYEVRKPLIYNLDVVGRFKATQMLGGAQ